MRTTRRFALVLVTAPDLKTARRLVKSALAARLIACASIVPGIKSHYRWLGKLERNAEVLLLLKTSATRLAALERLIIAEHPYDTPEFIVVPVASGNARYLDWLAASTGAGQEPLRITPDKKTRGGHARRT